MWALDNRTPYEAERNWTRDKCGAHWWIVAVRATYDVAPRGGLTLADEQLPPTLEPEYYGEPGLSSLRYDSDLLAVKPHTDVLVLGNAHAPGGRPVPAAPVGFRLGSLEKRLIVHGERYYRRGVMGIVPSDAAPFVTSPIRYEFAFGGMDLSDPDPARQKIDERNPVGRGVARRRSSLVDQPAHSVEYPDGNPASKGPAGFGPISPAWLPRRKLAGTYDEKWAKSKKPLLPDDYDPVFAQSAPADQRSDQPLLGGERLQLLNMTPQGVLQLDLPRVSLGFTTRIRRRREQHEARLVTVLLEPEDWRLSLVWQTQLAVSALDSDYLDETRIIEQGGAQ